MHNRIRNLRIIVSLCAIATVVAVVPSAQAAPGGNTTTTSVCNEARKGHEGQLTATDQDPSTPARNQTNLSVLGTGKGLVNAASHSPALSVCVLPGSSDTTPPPGDNSTPPPGGDGLVGLM
jgi:hypothetical protein